jgi:hypothetical protein
MPNNRFMIQAARPLTTNYINENGLNFTRLSNTEYSYSTIDLNYRLYNSVNNIFDMSNNFAYTFEKETQFTSNILDSIYNYQCMIIDLSGDYVIKASDYYNSTTSVSILEFDKKVPALKFYLFGNSMMNPITNTITYQKVNGVDNYSNTKNDSGGRGGVVIGTFTDINDLKTGFRLNTIDTDKIWISVSGSNKRYYAGNVNNITGDVYHTTNISDSNTSYIDAGQSKGDTQTTGTVLIPKDIQEVSAKSYKPKLEYTVKDASNNEYTERISYSYDNDGKYSGYLEQNGIESPFVNGEKKINVSAISKKIGTPAYAVVCARIPYAFINMYHYFYDTNNNLYDGNTTITININITNNGVIFYIPRLEDMMFGAEDGVVKRTLDINFTGNNNVIFMVSNSFRENHVGYYDPSKDEVIADGVDYPGSNSEIEVDRYALSSPSVNGVSNDKFSRLVKINNGEKYKILMRGDRRTYKIKGTKYHNTVNRPIIYKVSP